MQKKTPSLHVYTKEINNEVSIADVIRQYSGPVSDIQELGRKKIHCPSPVHTDNNPSANILPHKNACFCQSCKEYFDPIGLTWAYNPNLSFVDACLKTISDNNLDVYRYTNLREVEEFQNNTSKNKFFDYFPLTDSDLKFIGLPNIQRIKPEFYKDITDFTMKATEYYRLFCPDMDSVQVQEECFKENGEEIQIALTYEEASEIGLVDPNYFAVIDKINKDMPSIREMWTDDKKSTEKLIINFANKKIEALKSEENEYIQKCDSYDFDSSDAKHTEQLYQTWISLIQAGKEVKLTPSQTDKLEEFLMVREICANKEYIMSEIKNDISRAENIIKSVKDLQAERKRANDEKVLG